MKTPRTILLISLWIAADAVAAQTPAERLSDTGLFLPGTRQPGPEILPFSPQYPLWSDGASKRRWLYLPPGRQIDARNPDRWVFPPGTKVWKEFGFSRPIETRMIERLESGEWRFIAYVWAPDGSEAFLAPADGIKRHAVADAPGGRYPIPSQEDCLACHDGGAGPLLGVSALQLSPDRDPLAPHAELPPEGGVDLRGLHEMNLLKGFSEALLQSPPRIPAASPTTRAALGYLHGNCGACHNDRGSLSDLNLVLLQHADDGEASLQRSLETLVGIAGEEVSSGVHLRVQPGDPSTSVISFRLRTRNPVTQMPPLGRRVPDTEAIALVDRWIQHEVSNPFEVEHK